MGKNEEKNEIKIRKNQKGQNKRIRSISVESKK